MSSSTQLSERESNVQRVLLEGLRDDQLRFLVTVVNSRRKANSGNGFGTRTSASPSLKRPSGPTANDAHGDFGVSNKRRAVSETDVMPSTLSSNVTYMNRAPSVYDPNLDTARLELQTTNFGVNANVPYRGLASSLNGQAGTTFDGTNFQASDIYQGATSAPQTPVSMNGFVGNQMSSISFPPQDYSGFTGTVTSNSWLSPATPGTSPSDTAYSSAAFSPQRTPHSPYIPASSAIPGCGQNDFLSTGWRPQRRTPSTSPAPSNDAASACLQGTGGSIAGSTRSSPMMGPSPDAMSVQAGFESLDFWGFTASQIDESQPFLNVNAATESARPPVSTNEMQPLASSKSDLASKVADLTKKVESLTSENSALEGQLATLRDQQQKSDERSQATQEELTEFRRNMRIINDDIRRDIEGFGHPYRQ